MKRLLFILVVGLYFFNNSNAQSVKFKMIADSLVSPITIVDPNDGSNRLFIVDQIGVIRIVDSTGHIMSTPFLDLRNKIVMLKPNYDERGLLGLAFHPNFKSDKRFYVHYSAPPSDTAFNNNYVIAEFKVSSSDSNKADTSSEKILLNIKHPEANHNSGTIMFGPKDGFLYTGIGDGGAANDTGFGHVKPLGNGQDIDSNLLGSILRIDVDHGSPYGIPSDNPFVGKSHGLKEIYAFGFRNPYSFSFDMGGSNMLLVGDEGQALYEEVDNVVKGGNYGWNIKEGTHCFNPADNLHSPAACADTDRFGNRLINPVIEFNNSGVDSVNGEGIAVIGGFVYRGTAIPELSGKYVFGSLGFKFTQPSGRLLVATPDTTSKDSLWSFTRLTVNDSINAPSKNGPGQLAHFIKGFGQDHNGEIYVMTSDKIGPSGNTGKIFKLMSTNFPTDVAGNPILPADYKIYPAYPNPFNPSTTIRYYLPKNGLVRLDVFDVIGRKISSLVNEVQNQGMHEAHFNAASLSSGVYFYKFESNNKIFTGKLILMK